MCALVRIEVSFMKFLHVCGHQNVEMYAGDMIAVANAEFGRDRRTLVAALRRNTS